MATNFRDSLRSRIETSALRLNVDTSLAAIEITRDERFGDLTTNAAMVWAKSVGKNPRALAEELIAEWQFPDEYFCDPSVAGPGFINLRVKPEALAAMMQQILGAEIPYGHCPQGSKHKSWILEFVSANPTGPLNIVSARAAAIGDSLVRILRSQGYTADREFYVNDAGRQVKLFGESVYARMLEINGENAEFPEEGYRGQYVIDLAREAIQNGLKSDDAAALGKWAIDRMVEKQKAVMEKYRVDFQRWYRETELRDAKAEYKVLETLREKDAIYEKDGAQFLKTTQDGIDNEDRVVVTSAGNPTYFLPDIAYHHDKRMRGYDRAIDFLGPDHHGYIARMKAAMKWLGAPDEFLEIRLIQQVNLLRNGEPVKMSKRAGELVTLDDLLEELGDNDTAVDVARYFFLQRKVSTPLDFDLSLAVKQSDDNPAFYVQYAHARICSILRQEGAREFASGEWDSRSIELLQEPETRTVIRKLLEYPLVLERCIQAIDPNALPNYLAELAGAFHKFYHHHRVLGQVAELTKARVSLLVAVRKTLSDGLQLLGVTAPEQM